MSESTPIKLRIPRQDLAGFNLFPLSAEGAADWARALPTANIRRAATALRDAVRELNRVAMPPGTRFAIIEALAPGLQVALANLARRVLNQPLVLPEEPRQLAELAENLLSAFSTAYTLAAVHAIQGHADTSRASNPARLACEALQRAIELAGRRMLLAYQLNQPMPQYSWLTLHQLYALGERQGLTRLPVLDLRGHQLTLQGTYLQALLLGCSKANQLRQSDLMGIHRGLLEWAPLVSLSREHSAGTSLFSVDLEGDHPPMYHSGSRPGSAQQRYIDTGALVDHLRALRDADHASGRCGLRLDNDVTLPSSLLDHLISALGSHSLRNFSRATGSEVELEVAVGLSSVHFHTAGGRPFAELLPRHLNGDTAPFAARPLALDPWEVAEPDDIHRGEARPDSHTHGAAVEVDADTAARLNEQPPARDGSQRFPVFRAQAINSSPGGYCLEWVGAAPDNLRTGDVLCVREPGQSEWVIAAVRWISALQGAQTLVGVELLSPRGMPYGARTVSERGTLSEPMRILLLPEIKLVGKPHTLVTPRTGFREHQKVVLLREGEEFLIQLQRQVGATAGYSQFDFRYIRELEQGRSVAAEEVKLPRLAFDSLWSRI